jgi:hypothetical protein
MSHVLYKILVFTCKVSKAFNVFHILATFAGPMIYLKRLAIEPKGKGEIRFTIDADRRAL